VLILLLSYDRILYLRDFDCLLELILLQVSLSHVYVRGNLIVDHGWLVTRCREGILPHLVYSIILSEGDFCWSRTLLNGVL
jgi:hypothetical protein